MQAKRAMGGVIWAMLAGVLLCPSQTLAQGGPPPANVRLGTAQIEQLAERREVIGEVVARKRATLAGQQAGLVIELDVEPGDRVEQGDIIAKLDAATAESEVLRAQARVRSAEAVVARREAEQTEAKSDLNRMVQLDEQGSATPGELESAQTLVQVVQAQLLEAEAELASERADHSIAQKRLADMTIRAPFAGSVVSKQTEVGEWLGLGDPVAALVADDILEAWIDVPESVVGRLMVDTPVTVSIRAVEAKVDGRILGILPEADELSRLFRVRIEVPAYVKNDLVENELHVRPGMSVTAMIPTSRMRDVLTIPKDAIKRGPTGEFVFYDAGGVSGVAPIVTLFATQERVAVRSEVLRDGVSVVTQGNERMFPGQPLNVLPDRDPGASAEPLADGSGADPAGQGG